MSDVEAMLQGLIEKGLVEYSKMGSHVCPICKFYSERLQVCGVCYNILPFCDKCAEEELHIHLWTKPGVYKWAHDPLYYGLNYSMFMPVLHYAARAFRGQGAGTLKAKFFAFKVFEIWGVEGITPFDF